LVITHHEGEHVEPEHARCHHLFQHENGKVLEGDQIVHTTGPFLNRPDVSLDLGNAFGVQTDIETGPGIRKPAAEDFEFPSVWVIFTTKPRELYSRITWIRDLVTVSSCRLASISMVANYRWQETVTRNVILLMYIMSMHSVISSCKDRISGGTCEMLDRMCSSQRRTVFPLRECTCGPKMSSAARISECLIGQLGIRCWSTIFRKSRLKDIQSWFGVYVLT
jgi:hypothetical protein